MTFYNLCTNPKRDNQLPYTIVKFDADLNPESVYQLGRTVCECPAGHRPSCRHRDMLPKLMERVDTAWFWCFETKTWEDPTGEAAQHQEVAEHDEATGGLEAPDIEEVAPEIVEGTEPVDHSEAILAADLKLNGPVIAGEGPGPSTLAAACTTSPSASLRGEPATKFRRRL